MAKRIELQKEFDDRLDTAFGHLRFGRYGRCAVSAAPLAVSGMKLAANKISVPLDSMDPTEAAGALEREAQFESRLTDVLQLPTLTPATGYGLSVFYSRWRQRRLSRQVIDAPEPPAPLTLAVSNEAAVMPETMPEQHEVAV